MKRLAVLLGLVICAVTASTASTASATVSGGAGSSPVSSQMALDWNSYAVDAVRSAKMLDGVPAGGAPRALYQPEGLIYMAYVEAAVYDAVTKIEHRYRPYHHFEAAAGDASPEAAVASAAYATLVHYLGDPSGTLAAHYAASIAELERAAGNFLVDESLSEVDPAAKLQIALSRVRQDLDTGDCPLRNRVIGEQAS